MAYHIDLSCISVAEYKKMLAKAHLSPSRRILQHNIDSIFTEITNAGISNLKELVGKLQKKEPVGAIPAEEAVIILREIKSMLPKPNSIGDFDRLDKDVIDRLLKLGIKNTKQLYAQVQTEADREKMAEQSGIPISLIIELTQMADISRIRWANETFVRMLIDTGYRSVTSIATADATEMHEKINAINAERGYYKNRIGMNDFRIFIQAAQYVPQDIFLEEKQS